MPAEQVKLWIAFSAATLSLSGVVLLRNSSGQPLAQAFSMAPSASFMQSAARDLGVDRAQTEALETTVKASNILQAIDLQSNFKHLQACQEGTNHIH